MLAMGRSLKPLEPLLGKWEFTGNFHEDDDRKVKGWESYERNDDGNSISESWEVYTIWPDHAEVNKGTMMIHYNEREKKFMGIACDENGGRYNYEIRVNDDKLLILSEDYRFTGKFSDDKKT